MAFTKQIRTFITLALITSALVACAKKDSEFRARKTKGGANILNPTTTGQAKDRAAQQDGIDTEIYTIQAPVAGNGGGLVVKSYIEVNNKYYQVTINHVASGMNNPVNARETIEGATFDITGVCANEYCHPYYLVVNVYRGSQEVIQMAEKKFFYMDPNNSAQTDLYFANGPGKFVNLQSAVQLLDAGIVQTSTSEPSPNL